MKVVSVCLWCQSKDLKPFSERKDGIKVIKCSNCQLVMVEEIPENLDEYYYQETYFNAGDVNVDTGYAEIYDLMAPAFLYWQNSLVEETNESHDKKRFLEIGSATGNLLEIIGEHQPYLDLQGIDISEYAVKATQSKGFKAAVAYIEDYKAEPKLDIIFSSETMEHLDNLKSFLGGVAQNLEDDGTFLFYVPSIREDDAKKEKGKYVRFSSNLEHLLHFTPQFFEQQLPKFFDAHVLIKEFNTSFGPCIVGAVSKKASNLTQLKKLFRALETEEIPDDASDIFLKNLVVTSLKFTQFDLANRTFEVLEKKGTLGEDQLNLLQGLMGYHNGQLEKSNAAFEKFLMAHPGNKFVIKSLLANAREYNKFLQSELRSLRIQVEELEPRVFEAEGAMTDFKQSRIFGTALIVRKVARKVLNPIRTLKKKITGKARRIVARLIPQPLKKPIRYVIGLRWLERHTTVENQKHAAGQPLVSVVIPYYNRAATIDETLTSLRTQTLSSFEVIIVDDGSTEPESIDKLKLLNLTGLKTHIIQQDNAGVAEARNTGIRASKGMYVVCLDSDDMLEPTYLEKCVTVLETNADIDLVATDERFFGVQNLVYKQAEYNPVNLFDNNMVATAAMYRKSAWADTSGYKPGIGYEDWEFWIELAERGHWGKNIAEPLFNYRTALSSRFVEDKAKGRDNIHQIRQLHPRYFRNIHKVNKSKRFNIKHLSRESMFINLDQPTYYRQPDKTAPNILITVPWMTFGGAETLIYNFCKEIKDEFNISFITGLKSEHEWEYKFKEISSSIYHLANLFEDSDLYLEFISNYISTRNIEVLHIIHNGFMFDMLPEIRRRHPKLKIIVTMFNNRVEYFQQSVAAKQWIDGYVSDNGFVADDYKKQLGPGKPVTIIPNGVDCYDIFNPVLFNRSKEREDLGLTEDELAIFFIGRLSVEKNPDVFLEVAKQIIASGKATNLRFFMIGSGPMNPVIEKTIKTINSPRISYLGYQSEIAKYLSAADIFVLPSSIEGFPLSILEAMAMRVAVIASDVGAVAEVLDDGKVGYVVTPGSAKEIVAKLNALQTDAELLNGMKRHAREELEAKYSNKVLGKNYVKLYRKLAK